MKKRAQVTIFVILALAIVFAFGFLLYARDKSIERLSIADVGAGVELSSQKTALKDYIESCIEKKTKEAIDLFGLKESSEKLIRDYIEANLIECIDFASFENQGLTILRQNGFAVIDITDDAVLVDVYYPVTLIKDNTQQEMSRYSFYMARAEQQTLPLNQDGALEEEVRLVTEDGDAELIISAGTVVTKDGQPFSDLEFKIVDKNFEDLSNGVVIGQVVYQGTDDVKFDPAATLTIRYKPEEIPPGVVEENLAIVWYDQERDFWKALPTNVDTLNHILEAPIAHFTEVAVGSSLCKLTESNTQVISAGIIFKEMCRECTSETEDAIYFIDPGVVPFDPNSDGSSDSEGTHFGQGCVGPKDWDNDDAGDDCNCPDGLIEDIDIPEGYTEGDGIKKGSCTYTPHIPDNPATININEEEEESCDYELATPPTYGYNDFEDVGGKGTFTFYALEKGESCEAPDNEVEPVAEVDVRSPSGDSFSWKLNSVEEGGTIDGGLNTLYVEVYNTNNDACAEVTATITMKGFGILPECQKGATITKNCHCGYTNVDLGEGETKYCCESGVVVDQESNCTPSGQNNCSEQLSASTSGCWCNDTQYDFYGGQNVYYCCPTSLSDEPCGPTCPMPGVPPTPSVIKDITGATTGADRDTTRMCGNPWNCDDPIGNMESCILYWWYELGGNLQALYNKLQELGYATDPSNIDSIICNNDPRAKLNCDPWPSCEGHWGQEISRECDCSVRGLVAGPYVPEDKIVGKKRCPATPPPSESGCKQQFTNGQCCDECADNADYYGQGGNLCDGNKWCCSSCKGGGILENFINWLLSLFQ